VLFTTAQWLERRNIELQCTGQFKDRLINLSLDADEDAVLGTVFGAFDQTTAHNGENRTTIKAALRGSNPEKLEAGVDLHPRTIDNVAL
jgi:hypothetical protein